MSYPRLPRRVLTVLPALFAVLVCVAAATSSIAAPRVSEAYTAWDNFYFYAAFQVSDHNVISVNRTPVSQPQQDDDVEVFFNENPNEKSGVRMPATYQMAVSAGSGAYFSEGDDTKIPKAKLVLTYKYAVSIDGTLNDDSDNDSGFTVELAIPWQELGLTGPPAPGAVWGFNAISRNRESMDTTAQSFASLSPTVQSKNDIQNPSKWTKIQFISTLGNQMSGPNEVYCPHITSDTSFPVIDGVIRSGEWNTNFGYTFGDQIIAGAAPTKEEEPNISESPFATAEEPVIQTPQVAEEPAPAAPTPPADKGYDLALPGGGEVHVGKLIVPPPLPVVPPVTMGGGGHHKFPQYPGSETNPLAPNLPPEGDMDHQSGPTIDAGASLALVEQRTVTPLIVAPYIYGYPGEVQAADWIDQPINGLGPAFGGAHAQWDKDQLTDARRAGIDVLLPVVDPAAPGSIDGLAALVEAMKEMKAAGQDYPLLGLKIAGDDAVGAVRTFFSIVPEDFRAKIVLPDKEDNQPAYIVIADALPDVEAIKKTVSDEFDSDATVLITTLSGKQYLPISVVGPGGIGPDGALVSRQQTATLTASWNKVYSGNPSWVYVDSWNDFARGTEVAASREYGEQYADLTRIAALRWSGADEWDAKYLQNDVPTLIAQKTIYTVSLRVENNGSIPWRAGEGYSLCYRWYKDGRLYDDSAPRLPIDEDVYPGQSTTVKVGVLARNSYGSDIEPGRYTLVFDMVQGQSRWFSYVGSRPLRIPVRVEDPVDSPAAKPVVLYSTTPGIMDTDGTYHVSLFARNEGQETWKPGDTSASIAGNRSGANGLLLASVNPGAVGEFDIAVKAPADDAPGKIGNLTWTIKTPGAVVSWSEHPYIVPHDLGGSFTINNVPRTVKTDDSTSAKVALLNMGPYDWKQGKWKVGYEWLYLDGVPAAEAQAAFPIDSDVPPGSEAGASLTFKAPSYPGKYQLVLDFIDSSGNSTLKESASGGAAVLPMIINVEPAKNALATPVDLTKYFDKDGVGFETSADAADFDNSGDALPGSYMPPDGTQEINVNPLLIGKQGLPAYPSGYYTEAGPAGQADHRIAFLYGPKSAKNVVTCRGQAIDLPGGAGDVHILAAAVGSSPTVSATFVLSGKDGETSVTERISNWKYPPEPSAGTIALKLPYSLNQGAIVPGAVYLGHYSLLPGSGRRVDRVTLPSDPRIKVLAITAER